MFLDIVSTSNPTFTTTAKIQHLIDLKIQLTNQYRTQLESQYLAIAKDEKYKGFSTRWRTIIDLQVAIAYAECMFDYQYFQLDVDRELTTYPIYNTFDVDLLFNKYIDSYVDIVALLKLYGFDILNKTVNYTLIT